MFMGEYNHTIDAKGRLIIPSKFRELLGEEFVLTKGLDGLSLIHISVVSTMTDMVFPYFSLLGSSPEDFDPLTVVIILTMVMISGTLRFVQESRSGNAAEKLLSMITTTCTVTRREQEKIEIPMDDLVVGDIVHLSLIHI